MSTFVIDQQIKRAFEQEGMTPAQIASDFAFEETAVKAKLMQISALYRKACGLESEDEEGLNFTNEQLRAINDQIFRNATSATMPDGSFDYRTSQRACEYIRDDKKGRKEIVRAVQNNTFNLIDFNAGLQQARVGAEQARQKLIELSSAPKKLVEVS